MTGRYALVRRSEDIVPALLAPGLYAMACSRRRKRVWTRCPALSR